MKKILELFTPQPGFKILDITAHTDEVSRLLLQRLDEVEGRLIVAQYPGEHETLSAPNGAGLQLQTIPDYTRPFRALPRDNDIVFIRDVLHRHAQPERMLGAIYTTLTNAMNIVIVSEAGSVDPEKQLVMLENAEFRAGNIVEDVIEGYTVVMAKKMHMWGNGL